MIVSSEAPAVAEFSKLDEIRWAQLPPHASAPSYYEQVIFFAYAPFGDEEDLVLNAFVYLDPKTKLEMDTGSANLVVSHKSPSILPTQPGTSSPCQTLVYGAGSARCCLGAVRLTTGETLRADIVKSAHAHPNMIPPTNVMGLMPGTPGNQSSIVQQLNLDVVSLNFTKRQMLWCAGDKCTAKPSTRALFPRARTFCLLGNMDSNLTAIPTRVEWCYENGESTVWYQWLDTTTNTLFFSEGNDSAARQNVQPLTVIFDTGTTKPLIAMRNFKSILTSEEKRLCTNVRCTFYCYDKAELAYSMMQRIPEMQYLLSPVKLGQLPAGQSRPTVTVSFKLMPTLQRHGTVIIPDAGPSSEEGLMLILGLNCLRNSCTRMSYQMSSKIPFESNEKIMECIAFT